MTHSPPTPASIAQHNEEIFENRRHWERKPELQRVYARFYADIAAELRGAPEGPVLECGSGIGNLKSVLPHAIASDLFPNPWLDRQENVYALSYPDSTLSAVVLFDVFHHLEHPGAAFSSLARALRPGGRLVIFEPSMGVLGRIALGLFHHEPLALRAPITWSPPAGWDAAQSGYYAAQGNAWRLFGGGKLPAPLEANWSLKRLRFYPALPWLLSGGFRGPRLLRGPMESLASGVDKILSLAPRTFSSRLLLTLERR